MWKFTEWTGSNPLFFVKIKNSELENLKSSPSVLNFYKMFWVLFTRCTWFLNESSFGECENEIKFTSTPSELNLNCVSTLSELVILNHIIFSSLSVLIKLDTKIILRIEKREKNRNWTL